MRKLFTIVALLGLSVSVCAQGARADGVVDYVVSGTFAAITGTPSTSLSHADDAFTLTFSVNLNSTPLVSNGFGMTADITVPFVFTDMTTPSLSVDGSGTLNFFTACSPSPCPPQIPNGGLFSLLFTGPIGPVNNGNSFIFDFVGTDAGFIDGPTPTLNTGGPFTIGEGSIFGEATPTATLVGENSVSGTVTATPSTAAVPEPSSLLLLGSGFLAVGFARKRLTARFN
jgi:hypothetical protein